MGDLTYSSLADKLIEAVPELRPAFEAEVRWWGAETPGAHIVFGDVLCPYLVSLLEEIAQDNILRRIFMLLEEMANHEDVHVQEVVAVTVCEYLCRKKAWLGKAHTYMGPSTLRLCADIEAVWAPE